MYLESGEVLNLSLIKVRRDPAEHLYRSQPLGRLTPSVYKLDIVAVGEDINGLRSVASYQCSYPAPPTVRLSASPNPVDEGDAVTVMARLSSALSSSVTIPLSLSNGTAEDGDYGSLASITIGSGSTTGTGTISTNQDADTDDETFTVALGSLPSSVSAGSPSSVEVTINDDDGGGSSPTTLTLSGPEDSNIVEGRSYELTATASSAVQADTRVEIKRDAAASDAGEDDYSVEPIVIETGETTGTTMLMVTADDLPDGGTGTNRGETLVLFGSVDGIEIGDLTFTIWDAAVPALPLSGVVLLGALLLWRGAVRARRRDGEQA
ncbi:MAG: hypothetical protein OXG35_15055 [Acidobacteria bacterium]|nr:hypothetical protein [Acidobacteriota bacterium]